VLPDKFSLSCSYKNALQLYLVLNVSCTSYLMPFSLAFWGSSGALRMQKTYWEFLYTKQEHLTVKAFCKNGNFSANKNGDNFLFRKALFDSKSSSCFSSISVCNSGFPSTRDIKKWRKSNQGPQRWITHWKISPMMRELGQTVQPGQEKAQRASYQCMQISEERV